MGTANLHCLTTKGIHNNFEFHIVDMKVQTLLGLHDRMKTLQLEEEVHKIEDKKRCFDELSDAYDKRIGKLPVTNKMKLNPYLRPLVMPSKSIPNAVIDRVKQEVDEMERKLITSDVDEGKVSRGVTGEDGIRLNADKYEVMSVAPVSTRTAHQLRECTEHDGRMNGWPRNMTNLQQELQENFDVRDELSSRGWYCNERITNVRANQNTNLKTMHETCSHIK